MVKENYKTRLSSFFKCLFLRLHNLLFIEEAQQNAIIRSYDIRDTVIEKVESYERNGKTVPLVEPCSK